MAWGFAGLLQAAEAVSAVAIGSAALPIAARLLGADAARRFEEQRLVDIGRHRALAAEQATRLDMQRRRHDVAPDLAGGRDFELLDGGDFAFDGTRDVNVLRLDRRDHAAGLADDQVAEDLDIAFQRAVDPHITIGLDGADEGCIYANNGFGLSGLDWLGNGLRLFVVAEHRPSCAAAALRVGKTRRAG